MITEDTRITRNRSLGDRYGLLTLAMREMGRDFMPGQFVQMEIPGRPDLIMRRPMSPLRIRREGDGYLMDVLYLIVGEGTRHIQGLGPGDEMNLLGPLGRGFRKPTEGSEAFLIAGGTGLGPIFMLAEELGSKNRVTFFYGARTADELFYRDEIQGLGADIVFCTDDGSLGEKGFVTDVAARLVSGAGPLLYACGPKGMLEAVQNLAAEEELQAQISLEERMGCGVGACLSCAVRSAGGGYVMVCKDGPVFDTGDVIL